MDNKILLSIIIPVYNIYEYLTDCLNSIINQITDEVECILVDDGSMDGSEVICDQYAKKDERFKVIHKENGGLASARNTGIDYAKGKYLSFVDGDDRIANNSINQIIQWINNTNADFCFMQAIKFYPDGTFSPLGDEIYRSALIKKDREQLYRYLSSRPKYPGSACTKIYSKDFIKKNNLYFPRDKRYSEDLGFIRDCILKANIIEALDFPFYEYRQNRRGSITDQKTSKNFFDLTLFIKETIEILSKFYKNDLVKTKCILSFVAYEYVILLWQYRVMNINSKKCAMNFLLQYKYILKYGQSTKTKIVYYISRILGLNITSKLLCFIKK